MTTTNVDSSIELWKPVVGFEGYYEVSNKGRIKSLDRVQKETRKDREKPYLRVYKGKILTPKAAPTGSGNAVYHYIALSISGRKRCTHIHRLVALAFIENPGNLPQVNHKDGNGLNNRVSNLEWCTQSQNTKHAYDTGLLVLKPSSRPHGEKATRAKLKNHEVKQIKKLIGNMTNSAIATKFNVHSSVISRIKTGKVWIHQLD